MRAIDADALNSIKFHSLPYTHITPSDADAESYKRGWNDSIDSIIENAPTIEPERKHGEWTKEAHCPFCDFAPWYEKDIHTLSYCPNCGADLRAERRTDD
jgi:hypothetical protein